MQNWRNGEPQRVGGLMKATEMRRGKIIGGFENKGEKFKRDVSS